MSAAAMDANRISKAALEAAQAAFGGGHLVGERKFAVVVIVHQVGTEPGGLGISVASNLKGDADGIRYVVREGLRVVDGKAGH